MSKHNYTSPFVAVVQNVRAQGRLAAARFGQAFKGPRAKNFMDQGKVGYSGSRAAGSHMDQGTRGVIGQRANASHMDQGYGQGGSGPSGSHLVPGNALGRGMRKNSVASTTKREGGDVPGRRPVRTPDPVETLQNPLV